MEMQKKCSAAFGFTLIELLIVVAVITLLIGMMSTGMRLVVRASKKLKQKSILHAFETGLELYNKDFDDYPDSRRTPETTNTDVVCGAHHLAEALVGRDEKGLDPLTKWYAPSSTQEVYASQAKGSSQTEIDASLNRRKGPYVELRDTGVVLIKDLFETSRDLRNVFSEDIGKRSPVLTDIFTMSTEIGTNTFKLGTPILYFRANSSSRLFRSKDDPATTTKDESDIKYWIYDFNDNRRVAAIGPRDKDSAPRHFPDPDANPPGSGKNREEMFYERVTNPKVVYSPPPGQGEPYYKPYNPKTFILMSAGYDGVYGTKDDVTNFNY